MIIRELLKYDGDFNLWGPHHLTRVDWKNEDHKRSIAASLLQGVNVQQHDSRKKRQGPQAHASLWWTFFEFELTKTLIDDEGCIFGAIYRFNPLTASHKTSENAPKYVVAFRGTILRKGSFLRDVKVDFHIIRNTLHRCHSFHSAMETIQELVNEVGATNVWLVGHSLGSAIALLAAKALAKRRHCIETFLFNPPFCSAPLESIKNEKVKFAIQVTKTVVKAGIAAATKDQHQKAKQDDDFFQLSEWLPTLYVNPDDLICAEYIGYFNHRKKMNEIGAGKLERRAAQISIRRLFDEEKGEDSEPLHLVPSATLVTNVSHCPGAHSIRQWWNPNLNLHSQRYQWGRSVP